MSHRPATGLRLDLTGNTITWIDSDGNATDPMEPEDVKGLPVDTIGSLADRYRGVSSARRTSLMLELTRVFGTSDDALSRETSLAVRGSVGDPAADAIRPPKAEGDPGPSVSPYHR